MLPILLLALLRPLLRRAPPPAPAPRRLPARARKRINLALQGGGAHGAFTWGVLDQLLADGRVEVDGLSGTSAGAVNAVMLADGLGRGGAAGARRRPAGLLRAGGGRGPPPPPQRPR